jgi:hypothetical protein
MSDQQWQPPDQRESADSDERSLDAPRPPPQYSSDRRWWWTGDRWVPVSPPQYSPDRRWWWTGDRWVPVPPQVVARINWWAWAALAVGVLPFLSPLVFGVVVGVLDERSGGTSYGLSDALPVAGLAVPGVVLSVVGILVSRRRGGVGVWTAVAGGIAALAFSGVTLLLMFA